MAKLFVRFFSAIRNRKANKYIRKGASVLDIGCGNDYYLLRSIKDKISHGVGVDIAVNPAKIGNLTLKRIPVNEKLPFADRAFDVITMVAFIEHLEKPEKIFPECRRVLRPGGRIIITTPTKMAKPFWEVLVNMGLTEEDDVHEHKQYFYPELVEKMLKKNKFDVEVSKKFEFGMNYIAVGCKL